MATSMYKKGHEATGDIVAAADMLFQQRGFQNTSFQHLAEGSGIPKGNFYHYFRTKDELLDAVLQGRIAQLDEQLQKREQEVEDPLLRLEGFVRSLLDDPTDPFIYGCPHGSLCMELAKGRADLLRKGSSILIRLRNWFSEQFRMAGVADSDSLGLRLLSRIQGIILLTAAFQDEEFAKREIVDVIEWVRSVAVHPAVK
ncbi:TetR/AcrR family transcriptional regulator [Paraburkholderia sp. SIMBA_054]|uniref:TetR/AcrR family transcriptional regulator n=1 Tax=Paraburkholderia sp. SIMBA_054 TaxID=3085795 RepID=UPI00397AC771